MRYNVVIIDSGASTENAPYLDVVNLIDNSQNFCDDLDHGTVITEIIHNKSPRARLLMLKICNSLNDFSCEDIYKAFDYLINNQIKFDVMNISLGAICADYQTFKEYIDYFLDSGSIIVAANHPQTMSFPAVLDRVISVDVTNEITNADSFYVCKGSAIKILGTAQYIRIKRLNGYTIKKGSSFVAAIVSALLCNYFFDSDKKGSSERLTDALAFLERNALQVINNTEAIIDKGFDFVSRIKKAIVLPYNKEIRQIAANEDMIGFDIIAYYDFDISINNYKYIDAIDEFVSNHKLIKPYSCIDWDMDFDTVICGHCGEYDRITNRSVLSEVIDKCQIFGKKLYCFDQLSFDSSIGNIYYPHLSRDMIGKYYNKKLYNTSKPVLAIMGTSSVQGKFSLQLKLRKKFMNDGYVVSSIGTEPSCLIFGFDGIIPIGYNSNVKLTSNEFAFYVNSLINNAEKHSPDIIIIGSQSGTAPVVNNNLDYMFLRQHELLISSNPDAVVLCINYFDSIDYINKTINFIESCIAGKVIALYVSALQIPTVGINMRDKRKTISKHEMEQFLNLLRQSFVKPIFSMLDEIDKLYDYVLTFFSS